MPGRSRMSDLSFNRALKGLISSPHVISKWGATAFDAREEKQRNKAVAASLEVTLARFGDLRPRALELGIFPEDVDIPVSAIERLWAGTASLSARQAEEVLRALRRMSLFT